MAKTLISYFLACFLFLNSTDCISQVYSPCRAAVIENYKSQIGVREKTGKNDGEDIEKYLKTVGLGKGYAWCAAFVKWALTDGIINSDAAKLINGMALSLHKAEKVIYFKGTYKMELLPADVFTLWYKNLGRIGHTGFFNGWANKAAGTYYTVEGNTSTGGSREGDGVYLRIRDIKSTYSITKWIGD
ncbi:MAG TPA: hypothetical protein PLS00_17305 [Niabella sp.]|nr:hypothetical protein [Niabella sp.]